MPWPSRNTWSRRRESSGRERRLAGGPWRLTGIGHREIYEYARFAKAAYLESPELEGEFGDSVLVLRELASSRVQIALIEDRGVQWITIRGTANPKNVVVDGRIKVVREPRLGAYFHGGFLRASQEAHDAIRSELDPEREVRITGHSLGGAVALILAALLSEDPAGYDLGRTVTFGQPMVTDANGVKVLRNIQLLRVVNRLDPVAILPLILSRTHFEFPPTIFYRHVGPQMTLYRDRRPRYSAPGKLVRFAFGYKRLLVNHFIDLYLRRLQALSD